MLIGGRIVNFLTGYKYWYIVFYLTLLSHQHATGAGLAHLPDNYCYTHENIALS